MKGATFFTQNGFQVIIFFGLLILSEFSGFSIPKLLMFAKLQLFGWFRKFTLRHVEWHSLPFPAESGSTDDQWRLMFPRSRLYYHPLMKRGVPPSPFPLNHRSLMARWLMVPRSRPNHRR